MPCATADHGHRDGPGSEHDPGEVSDTVVAFLGRGVEDAKPVDRVLPHGLAGGSILPEDGRGLPWEGEALRLQCRNHRRCQQPRPMGVRVRGAIAIGAGERRSVEWHEAGVRDIGADRGRGPVQPSGVTLCQVAETAVEDRRVR